MRKSAIFLGVLLLLPVATFATTVMRERTIVLAERPDGNAYLAGTDVSVTAAIPADLVAIGGSVVVSAPISEDAFLVGGTIGVRKSVKGDLRAAGGTVSVTESVGGDLVAIGGKVTVAGKPHYVWITGVDVALQNGADGPVTVYGSSVVLAGYFAGDVRVVASDEVIVKDGAVITGTLRYNAPQEADIAGSAKVGTIEYTGRSYLPTADEARTFALAGAGVFFAVQALAALIAVGLVTGLFPRFAQSVANRALARSPLRFILLALLGFGIMVAGPVLCLLLLISFAGAFVAFILMTAYLLLMLLAYLFSGVLAGSALARAIVKRERLYWRDAVVGMLVLYLASSIPYLGFAVLLVLFATALGTIVSLFYRFAFAREETEELPLD